MASREINLISQHQVTSEQEQKLRNIVQFWMPIVLGIYTVVLTAILLGSYFFTLQTNSLAEKIDAEKEQIEALSNKEGLYVMLKQKSTVLKTILNERFPYTTLYDFMKSLEVFDRSDRIHLHSLNVSESGTTQITLLVDSVESLDHVINQLLEKGEKSFYSVELVSIGYNQDHSYDVTFDINAGKNIAPAL